MVMGLWLDYGGLDYSGLDYGAILGQEELKLLHSFHQFHPTFVL